MDEKGPQIPIIIQTKMFNGGVTPIIKLTPILNQYTSQASIIDFAPVKIQIINP